MLDISFELNGKKIDPNKIGKTLEKQVEALALEGIKENYNKKLGRIKCENHGKKPKIRFKGRSLKNLSCEVEGCCQQLITIVTKKLNSRS